MRDKGKNTVLTPKETEQAVSGLADRLADAPQHPFIRRMYEKTIRYYYPEAEKED